MANGREREISTEGKKYRTTIEIVVIVLLEKLPVAPPTKFLCILNTFTRSFSLL